MRKFRFTLGTKLVIGGLLFVLVPILAVGTFSVNRAGKALEATAGKQLLTVAEDISRTTQLALSEKLLLVQQLAEENVMIEGAQAINQGADANSAQEVRTMIDRLTRVMKRLGDDYEGIFVLDAHGMIRADGVGGSLTGLDVSDRVYFTGSKEGKANIGKVVNSKKINEPVVHVAAPIMSTSGEFLGAMVVSIKMSHFARELAMADLGNTGYASLNNAEGLCIAHKNRDLLLKADMKNLAGMERITAKILARETGSETYTFQGIRKMGAFAPVPLTGWTVLAAQDVDEFLLPTHAIRNGIAGTAAILLAFSFIIVFFASKKLSRPIFAVVSGLSDSTVQIAAAAHQVASASQQLAEGASEQAASAEETSASLEEMASMTRQNADNSAQANELMRKAGQVVSKANESMHLLTSSMDAISKASGDTQKIIKTIDEIAFQTNLLALNAAVEAARAGEAGSGFAVVADEVRNLAMRAAEAAKSTATLIEGTIRKVQDGSKLVAATNEEFETVSTIVVKSGDLIEEIASASQEQSQGIQQIGQALSEMEKVIQRNSANAEESAAASEEMDAQAVQQKTFIHSLVSLVGGHGNGNGREQPSSSQTAPAGILAAARKALPHLSGKKGTETGTPGTDAPKWGSRAKAPNKNISLDKDGCKDF